MCLMLACSRHETGRIPDHGTVRAGQVPGRAASGRADRCGGLTEEAALEIGFAVRPDLGLFRGDHDIVDVEAAPVFLRVAAEPEFVLYFQAVGSGRQID